jgi:hypothetical protein
MGIPRQSLLTMGRDLKVIEKQALMALGEKRWQPGREVPVLIRMV